MSVCSIEDCEKRARVRGWCEMHYSRWLRHGTPDDRTSMTETERFWAKVAKGGEDDCWVWTGAKRYGYGAFRSGAQTLPAHRFAYELLVGPVPPGLDLDHLCRNRPCVNPRHLEPVTRRVNTQRGDGPPGLNTRKTACSRGHPFTPENTHVTRAGHRRCLTCHRNRQREYERRAATASR